MGDSNQAKSPHTHERGADSMSASKQDAQPCSPTVSEASSHVPLPTSAWSTGKRGRALASLRTLQAFLASKGTDVLTSILGSANKATSVVVGRTWNDVARTLINYLSILITGA